MNSVRDVSERSYSISEWAQVQGISYRTAWRMVQREQLPVGLQVKRFPTGTIRLQSILVPNINEKSSAQAVAIYARINPRESRNRLDVQVELCRSFCAAKGWIIKKTVREIAPVVGVRKKLCQLLDHPPQKVVILTETIISRFDFKLLYQSLQLSNCELVVIDQSKEREGEGGALEDLIDAISITCHRHYGFKRGNLLVEALLKLLNGKKF